MARVRPSKTPHGTSGSYTNYACRCDECREAHRKAVLPDRIARFKWRDELKSRPCADCGVQYSPWVMQFDHLGDKAFGLAQSFTSAPRSRIEAEVAKCEIVCANCHAERTHNRFLDKNA